MRVNIVAVYNLPPLMQISTCALTAPGPLRNMHSGNGGFSGSTTTDSVTPAYETHRRVNVFQCWNRRFGLGGHLPFVVALCHITLRLLCWLVGPIDAHPLDRFL